MKTLIALSLLFFSAAVLAQPTRNKATYYDETDRILHSKIYIWGERIQDTEKTALKSNADIWYHKTTEPKPGYAYLQNGDYVEGELVWLKVYNKASFTSVTVEGGGKKPDPNGKKYYEIIITDENGKKTNYKLSELKKFGCFYTVNDYEPNAFTPGLIYHKNGDISQGFVRLVDYDSPYETMRFFGKIYFSENKTEPVRLYHSDQVEKVILQDTKEGTNYYYHLDDWLVNLGQYKESFGKSAGKNKFEPFASGVVYLQDGQVIKGKVALDKGKNKVNALYISEKENVFKNLKPEDVGCIKVQGEEGLNTYIPQNGSLRSYDDLMKKWQKKDEVLPGKIVFNNGNEINGKLVLGLDKSNVVKSYRNVVTLYLIPENSEGFVQVFNAGEDINYSEVAVNGATEKYVPLNGLFVDYNDLVKALEESNSSNPTENLQTGEVVFVDGTKKQGRISTTQYQLNFIGDGNELQQYSATQIDLIQYYTQNIDGKVRKFVPMKRRPNVLGADHMFVEIIDHDKRFSYYHNPMATNVRKGLTNFVGNSMDALGDKVSNELAEVAAREAAKDTYEKTGSLGETVVNSNKAYSNTLEETQGIISAGDESLYFEEWVIIDNTTQEKVVIYARNDKEVLEKLLNKCAASSGLSERELRNYKKMANLSSTMRFLNSCD